MTHAVRVAPRSALPEHETTVTDRHVTRYRNARHNENQST